MAGLFDFGGTSSTNNGGFLGAGIHLIHLVSVESFSGEGEKDGVKKPWKRIQFTVEDDNEKQSTFSLWSPMSKEDTIRPKKTSKKDGKEYTDVSRLDTFLIGIRHVIENFNPEAGKEIAENGLKFDKFEQLYEYVKKTLDAPIKNKFKTNIKLIPRRDKIHFNGIPGFFSALTKDGIVFMSNRFLGPAVSITEYEQDLIDLQAKTPRNIDENQQTTGDAPAAPEQPKKKVEDIEDDLPF